MLEIRYMVLMPWTEVQDGERLSQSHENQISINSVVNVTVHREKQTGKRSSQHLWKIGQDWQMKRSFMRKIRKPEYHLGFKNRTCQEWISISVSVSCTHIQKLEETKKIRINLQRHIGEVSTGRAQFVGIAGRHA